VYKLPVEICKTKETLHLFKVSRGGPVHNGLNLFGVHAEFIRGNNVTQEGDLSGVKLTLFRFGIQAILTETREDFPDQGDMIRHITGVDNDIV
jgi:hypothetical protein